MLSLWRGVVYCSREEGEWRRRESQGKEGVCDPHDGSVDVCLFGAVIVDVHRWGRMAAFVRSREESAD